jgi:hypothetical protein
MKPSRSDLEQAIKGAIQQKLALLPWRTFSTSAVARCLAEEVVECARVDREGQSYAPDQYTLSINPRETGELRTAPPEIQVDLATDLRLALESCGYKLINDPHITLATDPTLAKGDVRVIAWHSSDPIAITKKLLPVDEALDDQPVTGAFLVVEGKRHFPLLGQIVNIGRLPDNDLVLDDPHVSRRHAQLRAEAGHYRIIDLQSTVGTWVNGRLVTDHLLQPGDVISIARRIELIYGEDPEGPPDVTPPYRPSTRPPRDRHQVTPLDLKIVREEDLEDDSEEST